jgi:hypothetical protein
MIADNVLRSAPLHSTLFGDTTTGFTVTNEEPDKVVDRAVSSLRMSDQVIDRIRDKAAVSVQRIDAATFLSGKR